MENKMPVSDVLCEAMEYLVKLGSNLRDRSESLKEKRIRKEKLKNAHAVQKAAEKMLLICELSKKSLSNVEKGVKNVLNIVSSAQASTGGDGDSKESKLSPHKTISVSGKKYSLRFPKRVNVKHYMSLKVLARSMPKSMLDKYPVYYNCKLFRRRDRNKETSATKKHIPNKQLVDEKDGMRQNDLEISNCEGIKGDKNNLFDSNVIVKENETKGQRTEYEKPEATSQNVCESSSPVNPKIVEDLKRKKATELGEAVKHTNDSTKENDQVSDIDADYLSKKKNIKQSELLEKEEEDKCSQKKEQRESLKDNDEISKTKEKRKSHSSEEDEDHRHIKLSKNNKYSKESEKNVADDEEEDCSSQNKKEKQTKKYRKVRVIDDSSDSEKEVIDKNKEEKKEEDISVVELDSDKEDTDEKNKGNIEENKIGFDSKSNKKDKENSELSKTDEQTCDQEIESQPTKPLIKCVSLSKLLKPDILDTEDSIPKKDPSVFKSTDQTKKLIVHMNSKGEVKTKYSESLPAKVMQKKSESRIINKPKSIKKVRHQDDDEFWVQRRKEVQKFQPKSFSINVMKLPQLSKEFLQRNSLKRIIQNGSVICDIETDTVNGIETDTVNGISISNNNSPGNQPDSDAQKSSMPLSSTVAAKNALLNDSDAEKSESSPPNTLAYETENVKNSLLEDSESENNEEQVVNQSESIIEMAVANTCNKISQENPADDKPVDDTQNIENVSETNKKYPTPESADGLNNQSQDKQTEGKTSLMEETSQTLTKYLPEATDDQDKELAKTSLLNDSSDSSSKSPSKKRKRQDSGRKTREKHIMESMHAKKMLLTYSSSSDTEDEQFKNANKFIKDNFMKSIDDEEETKRNQKKIYSSSDSDEDLVQLVKKKQETAKCKSSSLELKTEHNKESDNNKEETGEHSEDAASEKTNSSSTKMGRSKGKPSGSSGHNSDTQDDKDIEGLTNTKSLRQSRRRRQDSGSDKTSSTTSTKMTVSEAPKIVVEGLLEAPESSDGSGAESDGIEEDLPPISVSGLNGSAIEHLAKDDLLAESDSDNSKDKDAEKDDDSDSETLKARRRKVNAISDSDSSSNAGLKAKRRKVNAISSDSEAGSSRRKVNQHGRVSDFEDSEADSESGKLSKRKKKGSDSDASARSSNAGKKKRRRIKQLDSDSSGSENEGKNKHGRKNIRKVKGTNQLEEATKKAAREEKERMARIAERQKMYNNVEFDETGKPDEVILDKVVLDFDPETKQPLIEVDRGLVKKLKPHQANGIKFMWDACFESVKRIKKDKGSGCILAHCMGLGKTLQVVALTHTLLIHSNLTGVNRVLVVCPLSTVLNWVNEFRMWLEHSETNYDVDVYELSRYKQNSARASIISQWFDGGGVCVLGYEMFRNLSADNPRKFNKRIRQQFQEALIDPGPDMVVCDEGHLLKNEKTSLSQSMNRVRTLRRIVLTGTPLQNNLKEYYCMVQFVKPNLLGKYNEYLNRFVNPITNGQYTDSTEQDIQVMKRRSHVLHKMLDGSVQRRDYGVLAPFLPPKHEYVIFITLSEVQIKLYQHYMDNFTRQSLAGRTSGAMFADFQSLQRIWTHPLVLKYNSERYEITLQKKLDEEDEEGSEGSLVDFIDDDSTPEETSSDDSSSELSDASDDSRKKSKKKAKEDKASARRATRSNPAKVDESQPDPEIPEVKKDNPTEWWIPLVTDDELDDMRNSHKLVLLFEILRQCEAIGDKLLVFSQSLYSLDLIEHFLGKVDEATQDGRIDEKLGGHVGSWSPGVDYFRLDGSTSCENRSIWCKSFNRENNPRARLFLISTRAGGLGINLVAANRVVIFDVSWNPSHDVQSIFRVYRFGQKKPCYVYRFLAMGTMEEKIYERQVTKQAISKRVIDEQQIDRHYAANDLAELYKFEPRPPSPRPVPPVPKDRFFAEMLKEHSALIYKFHEHDSLLENKEEETLDEEERKAAWEDFENEKNRPPPAPFSFHMANGMPNIMPNLPLPVQQQIFAVVAQMMRKDMPNLTDENVYRMVPFFCSGNPALVQQLANTFQNAQPRVDAGMINPMNAGVVQAAMGVGGGGVRQYESSWKQQQQQQHMMQRIRQHKQQSMQQPDLQPGEVVNLDSD